MASQVMSSEDLKLLSTQIEQICTYLDFLDYDNAHVSKRHKRRVDRFSIFHRSQSELQERVLSIHSKSPLFGQFKVHLIRKSHFLVHLDFEIGDATVEIIKIIKSELSKLQKKAHEQAVKKRAGVKTEIGTKNWSGLYIYRGKIDSSNGYFKNYGEAARQNIASPEFIQSMKEWNLYFRDVNYY